MRSGLLASPVLVTGGTGFIGREVTRHLLAAGRPVLALARARDGQSAADRVAEAMGLVPDGRRLDVIEADLTEPGCGLEEANWRRLRDTVETVIHCAGETTFFPEAMAPFRAGHIDGPLDLLRGLTSGRLRRWAHLSTAYVCGQRSGSVFEREGDVGQEFHNPYERVKLEAEAALRRAAARLGVDVRIVRPSIVVGAAPETAGGHPSSLFFEFIRMVAALGKLSNGSVVPLRIQAAPRARFNIVPVDYVAAATVALTEHAEGRGDTFHVVVSDAPTQEQVLAMIAERLQVRGLSLVDSRRAALLNPSPLERKVARMLVGYRDYLEQDVRFDDSTARRLLDRCEVPRPTLSRLAVDRLIDQALGSSTITIPPNGSRAPFALHPLTLS
ncbi:MAG: SDR family oxidoreductase [Acidobacteria bacterium]|nr:SDR family oxidoreductase [Acidobacteriota bacterium]